VGSVGDGPDAVSAEGLALLRVLVERGPMRVEDARHVLGLSTLRIAQELIRLTEQELVSLRTDGADDDIVELTERGAGFTEAQ
jgi:predicted ArsR family transcriptional regulator